jgi:hypothetical protein
MLEAPLDQVAEECRPAGFIFLGPFTNPWDLSETLGIDGTRDQKGNIANFTGPAAPHHDPVEIEVGMLAGYGPPRHRRPRNP